MLQSVRVLSKNDPCAGTIHVSSRGCGSIVSIKSRALSHPLALFVGSTGSNYHMLAALKIKLSHSTIGLIDPTQPVQNAVVELDIWLEILESKFYSLRGNNMRHSIPADLEACHVIKPHLRNYPIDLVEVKLTELLPTNRPLHL
jgi:hypothetical protein